MAGTTLTEMAAELGLSAATVSNVLNGKHQRFSDETVRRVLELARRRGYRPNTSARAMRSGRFGSLSLLVGPDCLGSYLPAQLLAGINAGVCRHDLHLVLSHALPVIDTGPRASLPKVLSERTTDGVIICCHHRLSVRVAEALRASALPQIWIDGSGGAHGLAPDHAALAIQAVRVLKEHGHRRIAFVLGSDPRSHPALQMRQRGYEEAMQDAGLTPLVRLDGLGGYGAWLDRLAAWLAEITPRPSGIICGSEQVVAPLLAAAERCGLQVPRDVSVVCIADDRGMRRNLPVTSIMVPWFEIGLLAVERLQAQIQQREQRTVAPPPWHLDDLQTVVPYAG